MPHVCSSHLLIAKIFYSISLSSIALIYHHHDAKNQFLTYQSARIYRIGQISNQAVLSKCCSRPPHNMPFFFPLKKIPITKPSHTHIPIKLSVLEPSDPDQPTLHSSIRSGDNVFVLYLLSFCHLYITTRC